MEYSVENENTLDERIRLILPVEGFTFILQKEGISFIYELNIADIKKQNAIIDLFFEIYDKIRTIPEFGRTHLHSIQADSVVKKDASVVHQELTETTILKNPFGKLTEVAAAYEYSIDTNDYKVQFGNFNSKDLKKHQLSQSRNTDLIKEVGFMSKVTITEPITSPSFAKLKALIAQVEKVNEQITSLLPK